jgi:hypothetical protein
MIDGTFIYLLIRNISFLHPSSFLLFALRHARITLCAKFRPSDSVNHIFPKGHTHALSPAETLIGSLV